MKLSLEASDLLSTPAEVFLPLNGRLDPLEPGETFQLPVVSLIPVAPYRSIFHFTQDITLSQHSFLLPLAS